MEPLIYILPGSDNFIQPIESEIYFDSNPSPKLIKYGFNNINEDIDMVHLTSTSHYKVGLNFDFERNDENSIRVKGSKLFGVKDFDRTFAEFWEILSIFSLLGTDQTVYSSDPDAVSDVGIAFDKLSGSKNNFDIHKKTSKGKISLILQKYSDVDIDENVSIQFILKDVPNLINAQSVGGTMILQLYGLQTQTMAEIIYYLSTFYTESYLIKPTITSDISDSRYLVLSGFKSADNFSLPSGEKNNYLISIGIEDLPNDFVMIIQCLNSEIFPRKYKKYNQIKSYLDTKVYEGATYQEMILEQNKNAQKWLEIFTDPSLVKTMLDQSLKKSSNRCATHSKLISIYL